MIMADQDMDGSHIKGLLINFFHSFWPSLLKINTFMKEFITPLIKATNSKGDSMMFFTVQEFEQWLEKYKPIGYKYKYYKGLGTSTGKEAKSYFKSLSSHKIDFRYEDQFDDEAIDLAFNK
jgi:DNA topoisomerase-2